MGHATGCFFGAATRLAVGHATRTHPRPYLKLFRLFPIPDSRFPIPDSPKLSILFFSIKLVLSE
ncbi:hypothetical protein [Moorena sp. SIO3E8]|uniref:hypothetical protein n=1 Tax=Moorena sp. SIO3E8 TaxID=2607830 RepID=UPI0025DB8CBC|nr:hypothetical protein [Moorena sp. SIO3E8]